MQIILDLNEGIAREIMDFADEELTSFEDALALLVKKGLEKTLMVTLDASDVDALVSKLIGQSLKNAQDKPFLLSAVYKGLGKKPASEWGNLHPTTRKLIGRRFRQAALEHEDQAQRGHLIVEFLEKTAQNSALYRVTQKS
ncbi:hypothetical protein [Pseudomonas sp. JBR1]|uniref:hypothetical protein n=1 Tax=Pseudomonas sp. JBR1 TaxID=3020907 RepID=UPI00230691F6|nr:hypothetical protein [Pseudomonas sp. JBR1]WCE10144.1 hypothetical protein PJ259_07840 [Pseudomonas sp. JBR1]